MSIVRVNKNTNYTTISNVFLRDKRLSLKAKGLLSYMMSCKDDWDFSVAGLRAVLKEGKDAISAALHELEENGYLIRSRDETQVGKSNRYIYDVYEEPQNDRGEAPSDPADSGCIGGSDSSTPKSAEPALDHSQGSSEPTPEHSQESSDHCSSEQPRETAEETHASNPDWIPVDNSPRRPENPTSGNPTSGNPPQRSTNDIRNTKQEEILIPKNLSTGNSNTAAPPAKAVNADAIREEIKQQIEYAEHVDKFHQEFVDCLVGLITEMKLFALRHNSIRIGEADYPPDLVLQKLAKLRWDHIQYIMDCMKHRRDPEPIRNIKAYLQKSILNAPETIDAWYMAEVQFDQRHR